MFLTLPKCVYSWKRSFFRLMVTVSCSWTPSQVIFRELLKSFKKTIPQHTSEWLFPSIIFYCLLVYLLVVCMFICFVVLNFPSNENVRKQHLPANAYSCINMKFSYTIAVRKDEIFYVVLLRKHLIFRLRLRQLFVDDI